MTGDGATTYVPAMDDSRDARTDRILDVALELAEQDGYEAVRLRQLAEKANVALGTVYRRFASKEDILAAVLEREVARLQMSIESSPFPGDSERDRLHSFFELATRTMSARPKLASAMFRTVASGDPHISQKVSRYYSRMNAIILLVQKGGPVHEPSSEDVMVANLLQSLWFAALVGWTGGMHDLDQVIRLTHRGVDLILAGRGHA